MLNKERINDIFDEQIVLPELFNCRLLLYAITFVLNSSGSNQVNHKIKIFNLSLEVTW